MDIRDTSIKIPAMSPEYTDADDYITADVADEELTDRAYWEQERKKVLWDFLIFFAAVVIVAIAIGTVAWFASNKDVGGNGMAVTPAVESYLIVPLDGNTSIYQEYYDYISDIPDNSMEWKMTAENNMENYEGDVGISPGSFGSISFYVKPRDASVTLDLSFEIVGYKYAETTAEVTTKSMTEVSNEMQGYLAGHIFLFETRTPVYDDPAREDRQIVSYMYSDPILSGAELTKVISDRPFNKADEDTPVDIYWVWPKTLSTLVDATANAYVSIEPFSEGDAYTAVVNNVTTYPARYLYQYSNTETALTAALISNQYETYGDLYDSVDNEIGLNVSYITVKMTTTESAQETP